MNEYSSYTDSVLKKQVEFSGGDKLRVTYTFGNVKPDLSDIPYKLTNERFEELQKRAEEAGADERLLKRRYTQDKDTGIWTRKDLIADQAEKLKEWFKEINYTAEDIGIINYLINSNVEIYYQEFYSSKKERIAPIKE